jgi:DNA-binding transcriptional LysR family regulator
MPPLRMIEAFEAVVRLGSRAAAAQQLNVTTGAISRQIRTLETWVGLPLFAPRGRGAELTQEGRTLAAAVTDGFARIREGVASLAQRDALPVALRISAPATMAMKWLVPLLPRMEQAIPGLRLTVHATNTGEDWMAVPHDAAIRRDEFIPAGYEAQELVEERLTAYAAPALAARASSPDALPLCESATRPGDLDRWLDAAGVPRIGHARRRYSHFYIAYHAALAGEGLIVAPTFIARRDVAEGRFVAPWPSTIVPGARCRLVYPATPAARRLVAPLLEWLRVETESG